MRVHIPFRLNPIASLAWLGKQLPCPLHVKGGGKTVKEVAVEIPLSRGERTHTGRRRRRFFQKTVARVVVVSFLDIEPH